jgi:hypothetical protein
MKSRVSCIAFGALLCGQVVWGDYIQLNQIAALTPSEHLPNDERAAGLEADTGHAYVPWYGNGRGESGILVIDISTPTTPRVINNHLLGIGMSDIALRGDRLYGIYYTFGEQGQANTTLELFDASVPTTLHSIGTYNTDLIWSKVWPLNETHVLLYSTDRMIIVDVTTPANINLVATLDSGAQALARDGDYLIGCNSTWDVALGPALEVTVYDLSTPSDPAVVARGTVGCSIAQYPPDIGQINRAPVRRRCVIFISPGSPPPLMS